jgi:hypothetical protein
MEVEEGDRELELLEEEEEEEEEEEKEEEEKEEEVVVRWGAEALAASGPPPCSLLWPWDTATLDLGAAPFSGGPTTAPAGLAGDRADPCCAPGLVISPLPPTTSFLSSLATWHHAYGGACYLRMSL